MALFNVTAVDRRMLCTGSFAKAHVLIVHGVPHSGGRITYLTMSVRLFVLPRRVTQERNVKTLITLCYFQVKKSRLKDLKVTLKHLGYTMRRR